MSALSALSASSALWASSALARSRMLQRLLSCTQLHMAKGVVGGYVGMEEEPTLGAPMTKTVGQWAGHRRFRSPRRPHLHEGPLYPQTAPHAAIVTSPSRTAVADYAAVLVPSYGLGWVSTGVGLRPAGRFPCTPRRLDDLRMLYVAVPWQTGDAQLQPWFFPDVVRAALRRCRASSSVEIAVQSSDASQLSIASEIRPASIASPTVKAPR